MKNTNRSKAILTDVSLFYATAVWGSTFFVVKDSLANISPILLVGYRFFIAALVLLALPVMWKKKPLANWPQGVLMGVVLWCLYTSQTVGLVTTTASKSGFITGLFVFFVPLIMFIFFRKIPSLSDIFGVVISLCGLWIMTGGLRDVNSGDLYTLVCAVVCAVNILMSDHYMKMGLDPYVMNFQQFMTAGIIGLVASHFMGINLVPPSMNSFWYIGFLVIFPSVSAYTVQMYAQRTVPPIKVSLIFALEPVFAAAFAWTVGGETCTTMSLIGGILIFAGILISQSGLFSKNEMTQNECVSKRTCSSES
ncbi:MAG: DMT family transporter [Firmicutes bacterium]|nr:DMT family transporter [Bacillota bacterium]